MKKTEKAAPWRARSSGNHPSASGTAAKANATAAVRSAPHTRKALRPPRSTHAPISGWTTMAVALKQAMINPT